MSPRIKKNRVKATLTKEQWDRIDKAVSSMGKKNLQSHIGSKLNEIDSACINFDAIEQCEDCKEERIFWLTPSASEIISRISNKTGIKDASTIVSRLIIAPLLIKE